MKNSMNSTDMVKAQYKTSANLNTRINIHEKYSTNKQGFGNWIVSNYDIKTGSKILELGCGTGSMWKSHLDLLDNGSQIILTDFSEGMIDTARATLGEHPNVAYQVVDIENIPFEDNSFDIVIANMMLYHVPHLGKGLEEVRRVLKKDGCFYCATFGENGILPFVCGLLKDYGVEDKTNTSFTLQNGGDILQKYFSNVCRKDYEDSLAVTNLDDLINYLYSYSEMTNIVEVEREKVKTVLKNKMLNDVLIIPKEYGTFICK